ncbi:uncharacterized protein PHACADRAFT_26097 [Phanerochaete carnosa HHB-10118-sp]|uniref:Uncharacterized protein n=1 Tax=Phanerochaete carnosa (strain HHB-10118-sp) TaxID=650164 RepID=K5WL12_PHACS|nr:uncharacterized protein PHACADRAFT_26097 [Phanerochaete carnosa HHB-10118-sp]EKM60110.1 hypothetical protein PHACADRAFT_26097 [Phanerochaete carnosa HHB-10118-sp]
MINASPVVLEELEEEMKGILQPSWYFERGTYTIQVSPHTAESLFEIPASTIDQHLATMTEPDLLFRALSWITAASQDVGLLQQLRQCSNSIRPPNLAYSIDVYPGMLPTKKLGEISNRRLVELAISRSFRHLTLFYTLARACMPRKTDVETIVDTQLKLYNTACDESKRMAASSIGASVLKRFRTMYTVSPEFALRLKKEAAAPVRGVHVELSVPQRRILSYLLMSELKAAITEMLSAEVLDARHDRRFLVLFSRRAAEILCGLREVALNRHSELPIMEFHGIDCLQELSSLYNTIVRHPEKQQFDEAFPGLRSFFLDFMSDYVHFDFDEDNVVKGERPPSISAQIALENEDRPYGQLDAAAWLTLVGKYSLDQPTTTREDYNIFALLASRAFRAWKDEWMLQPQTSTVATLCKKSADFLHRAGAKGWNNGGSYQSLDWLVAADERSFISHSNTAFCELLYKHAPDEFTDLLYAFEKHCHLIDHTRHDLRYMLGRLRPGEGTTGPSHVTRWHSNWWLSPFGDIANASLGEWTALIQHFTFPTPAHTRTWHHLFVWAANEWILKVGQYAVESPLALDRDIQRWMATHFPKVLEAMATGLDFAVEQGWENGGYDNTSFPWLPSIFLAPSLAESQNWSIIWERDKVLFRSHKVYAPIVYLECFAPAALRLLAISLTRTVVHGYFTNASIQDDVYLLRSYLKASPHERKEIVQRRQRGSIRSEEQQPGHASGVALEEPCRRSPRARATPSTGLKSDPSPDEEANLSLFRALPYHDDLDADDNRPRTFSKRVSHVGGYPIRSGSPASYADSAGFATANTSQKDGDHGPALGFDESRKDGNRESDILDTTQPILNYHWLHDMDERPFVESPVAFSSRRSLDEMDLCVAADDLTAELRLNTHFESALDAVHREDSIQLVNPQSTLLSLQPAKERIEVIDRLQLVQSSLARKMLAKFLTASR